MNSADWLSRSNEEFVRQYAPHAAAKSYGLPRPLMTPAPSAALPGPSLGIAAGLGQPHQPPYQPQFHSQKEYNMPDFDFAHLPPQIDRRLAIRQ